MTKVAQSMMSCDHILFSEEDSSRVYCSECGDEWFHR